MARINKLQEGLQALSLSKPPLDANALLGFRGVKANCPLAGPLWLVEDLAALDKMYEPFHDLSGIFVECNGPIEKLVVVEYFDDLYSQLKKTGHPLTSIVFLTKRICIVRPKADLPANLDAWIWEVVRKGLRWADIDSADATKLPPAVYRVGP